MIQKRVPIIAFIEGQQFFDTLSTILMCPIRIMMKPSIIQSSFSSKYSGSAGWGWKTIDLIDNSLYIFDNIVKLYKDISNLPESFYKKMRYTIINLDKKDLIKYNIIHICLDIHKDNITLNDVHKYLQLDYLSGFNDNKVDNKKYTKKIVKKLKKM
jgi:hypothetical protein